MSDLRRQGLTSYLARHGRAASPELDRLCAQKDAHTSLLFWFTELPAAITEARRTKKPILSLRLLGRLDEELSCANSRFFRKLLYPQPAINQLLRDHFVLHWQSVRPVPRVTIDFGGGKRIEKTLTGNSCHVVLDPDGRPADVLPGLFSPTVFHALLVRSHGYALANRAQLADLHRRALAEPPPVVPPSRAMRASMIAPTKHMVEMPVLRAVAPVGTSDDAVDADTRQNLALHARVHHAFASGAQWSSVDAMVSRIYSDLFLMPIDDPALGLDVPDPFAA
ncbi:MAG TPA: hypothetical protein VLB44_24525 [Kofleriaceae bacterium]|nr:hypothetical protein [Kofleriaceae bacterium]